MKGDQRADFGVREQSGGEGIGATIAVNEVQQPAQQVAAARTLRSLTFSISAAWAWLMLWSGKFAGPALCWLSPALRLASFAATAA
ncbi:hypothetical protein [Xenophilus sp.]|uniref:hypothetical protein n=1 Tax=Xenophilus sp. TaxID=1873499 RepID=UPI0037DD0B4A